MAKIHDLGINLYPKSEKITGQYAPGTYTNIKSHQDYDRLLEQGAVYTAVNGWERPIWFSLDDREEQPGFRRNDSFEVVAQECKAVREHVGLWGLPSFAKYDVKGKCGGPAQPY